MKLMMLTTQMDRAARTEYVASQLLPRTGLLTRLLRRDIRSELSGSESGVLNTLREGPRRITELAELEGVAQPTMTLIVKRLEGRGFVTRGRQPADGRVVVVSLSEAGAAAFEELRECAREMLGTYLVEMSDEQIGALAAATETLAELAALIQNGGGG
jgi:DNA-binding MarR family transcriptional regulator